jgi:uncharacterized caspase-like protein
MEDAAGAVAGVAEVEGRRVILTSRERPERTIHVPSACQPPRKVSAEAVAGEGVKSEREVRGDEGALVVGVEFTGGAGLFVIKY